MINGVKLKYIDRFELDLINGYYCIHLYYSDAFNNDFGSIMIYHTQDFNEAIKKYDELVEMLYKFKFKGESCL